VSHLGHASETRRLSSGPVLEPESETLSSLRRRHARERRARLEAEAIAERVTGELYGTSKELQRLNFELERANEELHAANQAIRDFVAVASHDLKGPLTAILGSAILMRERFDDVPEAKKRDFLAIIERQTRHLARLVDDLLTLSRIEAGALKTHAQAVDLHKAIQAVVDDFAEHSSEICVRAPESVAVLADPDHLQRILDNYLGNALKYGSPPIEVEATNTNGWVEIRVRDHGEGVPPDFVPRLFGKFARADTEGTRSAQGTGLGLSIVRGLAQANGGETWYEPNRPHGSCFAVRLPKHAA
jgi:signal transduction histidine kinase